MSVKRSRNIDIQSLGSKKQKKEASFTMLPDELIITIFEYLKPYDILYSFTNLTQRFTSLILKYKQNVDLRNLTNERLQQILPLVSERVISLKIDRNIFFENTDGNIFQQFPSLQELSISKINLRLSGELLPYAPAFKNLTKLEMKCDDNKNIYPVTKIIHQEFISRLFQNDSSIKELSIRPISELIDDTIAKLSPCHLRKLEVHLTNGRDFFTLFNYIPEIEVFKCCVSHFISEKDIVPTKTTISHLKEFSLESSCYTTDLSVINSFLKDHQSLEKLSLNLWIDQVEFTSKHLNGNHLREKLLQHLIHLKSFQFNFSISYGKDNQEPDINSVISTFQTDYWLKKHDWNVGGCYVRNEYTSNIYLFSLPYTRPQFLPTLKEPNFGHLNLVTTLSPEQLSSELFNNVRSVSINDSGTGNANLLILKLVQTYFMKITTLMLYNDHISRTVERLTIPDELVDLRLPRVKKLKFYGVFQDLKKLFSIFPNLKEIEVTWDELLEAHDYIVKDNGGQDLLQLKHLKMVNIDPAGCQHGDREIEIMNKNLKKYFLQHLPGITLQFPVFDNDEETEEDDDDDDNNDEDDSDQDD